MPSDDSTSILRSFSEGDDNADGKSSDNATVSIFDSPSLTPARLPFFSPRRGPPALLLLCGYFDWRPGAVLGLADDLLIRGSELCTPPAVTTTCAW